jgi:hypothetical protein
VKYFFGIPVITKILINIKKSKNLKNLLFFEKLKKKKKNYFCRKKKKKMLSS